VRRTAQNLSTFLLIGFPSFARTLVTWRENLNDSYDFFGDDFSNL
jgi:hypothetical protein